MEHFTKGAEAVTLFCRLNMNTKKDLPIRASEMGMLIYIVKSAEPITSIKVSEFFKVTKPNVAAMVNSMLKKGYITKEQSKVDKRSFVLKPTKQAIYLVEETYNEYFKTMQLLNNKMGTSDYNKLIELLGNANRILLEEKNNG